MKTKEEILGHKLKISGTDTPREIYEAMDEYAKEMSIGFFKWVWFETKWELTKEGWYDSRDDDGDPIYITDEQLYNQFIESLKQ